MERIERVTAWAREIGPWRLGFGLLAVGGAYAEFGMGLSGNFARRDGWGFLMEWVTLLGVVGSSATMVTQPRRMGRWGVLHSWFVMWGLLAVWALFPVPLPASQDDFRAFVFPLAGILFGTIALSTDRGWEWPRRPE